MLQRSTPSDCVRRRRVFLVAAALALLAGCGGRPMPFPTPESELGDRPGFFTGEKGAWEVLPRAPQPPPR
jgi:hypothetical protein